MQKRKHDGDDSHIYMLRINFDLQNNRTEIVENHTEWTRKNLQ